MSAPGSADPHPPLPRYATLLADGAGGGWAFGPHPRATPAQIHPADAPHVTVPLCNPADLDAGTVARTITPLTGPVAAALATGSLPPVPERHLPAVAFVADASNLLAVTIGPFPATAAAHVWWSRARRQLPLEQVSVTVFPIINNSPEPAPAAPPAVDL
jgi:hypothetical protein